MSKHSEDKKNPRTSAAQPAPGPTPSGQPVPNAGAHMEHPDKPITSGNGEEG
jgi:hypothetical protein